MASNLFYYVKRFGYNLLPRSYFEKKYKYLIEYDRRCNQVVLIERLNYYINERHTFNIPKESVSVKDYKRRGQSEYYLDLKEFLHYFSAQTRFAFHFGDETNVNSFPTLTKARPINAPDNNSVLFKLNKRRHFNWVEDPYSFSEKMDKIVWRGQAHQKSRIDFVRKFWNEPFCNVGQTNKDKEEVPWQKEFLTISEQLKYKFIFCPEGNDVATNLKWAMSSNSLCFMPKPKYETWFMEGLLKPRVHYVEVKQDFSDLEDKILYYSIHINEAELIIKNAHKHVDQFRNIDLENLLCLKVLERYTELSGQQNALLFKDFISPE